MVNTVLIKWVNVRIKAYMALNPLAAISRQLAVVLRSWLTVTQRSKWDRTTSKGTSHMLHLFISVSLCRNDSIIKFERPYLYANDLKTVYMFKPMALGESVSQIQSSPKNLIICGENFNCHLTTTSVRSCILENIPMNYYFTKMNVKFSHSNHFTIWVIILTQH